MANPHLPTVAGAAAALRRHGERARLSRLTARREAGDTRVQNFRPIFILRTMDRKRAHANTTPAQGATARGNARALPPRAAFM
jgi:hypothetical protein